MASPKLDKNHGFMKFIVQNQIDRDQFEQDQRALKSSEQVKRNFEAVQYAGKPKSHILGPYVHPNRRATGLDNNTKSLVTHRSDAVDEIIVGQTTQQELPFLFELEYAPKCGKAISVAVYKNSSVKDVVASIAERCAMEESMKQALCQRIQLEIENCN